MKINLQRFETCCRDNSSLWCVFFSFHFVITGIIFGNWLSWLSERKKHQAAICSECFYCIVLLLDAREHIALLPVLTLLVWIFFVGRQRFYLNVGPRLLTHSGVSMMIFSSCIFIGLNTWCWWAELTWSVLVTFMVIQVQEYLRHLFLYTCWIVDMVPPSCYNPLQANLQLLKAREPEHNGLFHWHEHTSANRLC